MAHYRSFGEQSLHYFDRPHDAQPLGPLDSPAAWRGDAIASDDTWLDSWTPRQLEEIEAAILHAKSSRKPTEALGQTDFPLPRLSAQIQTWRNALSTGRGFVVIRGLPIGRWSDEDVELFFWCFGLHLGLPGGQNPKGDLLGHVRDTRAREHDAFVRLYQTTADIAYHCDAADVVGLLCKQKAKRGGLSRIVSSVSVYNDLIARRPDLAARLFEPMLLDIRDAKAEDALRFFPVYPCRFSAGALRTFYHSDYFRSVQRHHDAPRHSAHERELLDLYEEIALTPGLYFDMELEPGDIQLVSNHSVLHARTAYEDGPDSKHRRHLLRLWLSLDR